MNRFNNRFRVKKAKIVSYSQLKESKSGVHYFIITLGTDQLVVGYFGEKQKLEKFREQSPVGTQIENIEIEAKNGYLNLRKHELGSNPDPGFSNQLTPKFPPCGTCGDENNMFSHELRFHIRKEVDNYLKEKKV